MSNYSLNNIRRFNFILNEDEYWDLHVNNEISKSYSFSDVEEDEDNLSCYIDTDEDECVSGNTLNSIISWSNACSLGLQFDNIGLTGVDNGLIPLCRDRVTNDEFYKIYTDSHLTIDSSDTLLHLHSISSNTNLYAYPTSINSDGTIKLNGGFYQGFFKSKKAYQILPTKIDNEWNFVFEVKKEDYVAESNKTLNDKYPDNKGIFFYIGTRAQNKWMYLYNDLISGSTPSCEGCEDEFDLIEDEMDLSTAKFETDNGFKLNSANDRYTLSNNKFILFDRTPFGIDVNNYKGDEEVLLSYKTKRFQDNLFLYLNRTPSGYTTSNIDTILDEATSTYNDVNRYKDIYNNALAFFIDDNGAIGYKYLIKDCSGSTEGNYSIEMGKSLDGMITTSEWAKINIKLKSQGEYMKMYFYINGKLKYITKNLPMINLHSLDELEEKQEGVPYNISIGGGTQGLLETVLPDYMAYPTEEFELEKYFGGTFIGDFKSFRLYTK